jgi:hypothetical protein
MALAHEFAAPPVGGQRSGESGIHRAGVLVVGWHTSALIVWNGQAYVWVQNTD